MSLAAFLRPLLQWDPTLRPEASQVLQHPWLEGSDASELGKGARDGSRARQRKGQARGDKLGKGKGAVGGSNPGMDSPFSDGFSEDEGGPAAA